MNVPVFKNYTGLVYTPKSGTFKFAEMIHYTEILQGTVADARTYGDNHHRGSIWTFSGLLGAFCVEESTVEPDRGGIGTVTVEYVWLNSVPPDEWSVTPFEINPPIERATFFAALTVDDLKKAKAYFTAAQALGQTALKNAINGTANATLTTNLVNKWLRGQETLYMPGLKYQWKAYFTSLTGVILRRGGYIETPGGPGVFPGNFVWLRQCDEMVWNNGIYGITRTWVGAPSSAGIWDSDLYGISPV